VAVPFRRRAALVAVGALALVLGGCGGAAVPKPASSAHHSSNSHTVATAPPTLKATLTAWTLPAAVSRPVVLNVAGAIDILGGLATGDVSTASVVSIDPASGNTGSGGRLEEGVHDAAGAYLAGTAMVFGGGSYADVAAVQGWVPGTAAATVIGHLPVPRSDLAAVTVGTTAFVLGGLDANQLVGAILATTDGIHFHVVGALPQPVRYPAVAVDGTGDVWVFGGELGTGENADAGGATSDIQRFDPKTGLSSVVGHLPAAMGHAEAFDLGGQLFVTGGRTAAGPSATIWRIDQTSGTVTAAGSLPGPRSDAGAVVVGGIGYLVGGEVSGPTAPLNTVVRLTLTRQ
jgi:hypothetical protein